MSKAKGCIVKIVSVFIFDNDHCECFLFYVCCKCWYAWLHMLNCALHSNCPFPVAFSVYSFQLYCAPLPWIKLCKLLMNRAPEGCCFPFFLHTHFLLRFFLSRFCYLRPIQVAKEKSKIKVFVNSCLPLFVVSFFLFFFNKEWFGHYCLCV